VASLTSTAESTPPNAKEEAAAHPRPQHRRPRPRPERGEYPDLPAKLKKPVSFIAACHELARADQIGPDFITHLPMSFDGRS
jgi:hypothetical protein